MRRRPCPAVGRTAGSNSDSPGTVQHRSFPASRLPCPGYAHRTRQAKTRPRPEGRRPAARRHRKGRSGRPAGNEVLRFAGRPATAADWFTGRTSRSATEPGASRQPSIASPGRSQTSSPRRRVIWSRCSTDCGAKQSPPRGSAQKRNRRHAAIHVGGSRKKRTFLPRWNERASYSTGIPMGPYPSLRASPSAPSRTRTGRTRTATPSMHSLLKTLVIASGSRSLVR